MKMICSFSLGMIFAIFAVAQGQDDQARGLAIATQGDAKDQNWGNAQVACEMVLQSTKRKPRSLKFQLKFLEGLEGDKSIVIFTSPVDIRGTTLLTHTRIQGNDGQRLVESDALPLTTNLAALWVASLPMKIFLLKTWQNILTALWLRRKTTVLLALKSNAGQITKTLAISISWFGMIKLIFKSSASTIMTGKVIYSRP